MGNNGPVGCGGRKKGRNSIGGNGKGGGGGT
jgi:hypothetical protein